MVPDRRGWYWFYDPEVLDEPIPRLCRLKDRSRSDSGFIFKHPAPESVTRHINLANYGWSNDEFWCADFEDCFVGYIPYPNEDNALRVTGR